MASMTVDPSTPVDYSSSTTPGSYACTTCGKTGVKLWRDYGVLLEQITLACMDCACASEKVDAATVGANGSRPYIVTNDDGTTGVYGTTDQIGSFVPAVPTTQNDTFWNYTSVPVEGCQWWDRLPLR